MKSAIAKWGNSLALRLPRALAESAALREGSAVDLRLEGDSLVITPTRPRYRLEDLLASYETTDDEAESREVDWGPPQGKEEW